jgi:alkanesulfonate monooxygenase SsuD/methylene tetrahydromethanopterin reductase-like flavin-dependent oxidoreductase (luciferase family)
VDGAIVRPLPLQPGGIPMWVAGGGEKVTLKIAAKYASYTNFDGSPDGFTHKSEVLRRHTDAIGRDFAEITRSSNYNVMIGSTEAEVEDGLRRLDDRVRPYLGDRTDAFIAEYRAPGALAVGTPEQIVERLADMRKRGLGYGIFYFPDAAYDRSSIELFEREVLAELAD